MEQDFSSETILTDKTDPDFLTEFLKTKKKTLKQCESEETNIKISFESIKKRFIVFMFTNKNKFLF